MINLLYKDFKLVLHPTNYIFLAFPAMLLIPNYPAYVAYFYLCLSVFFMFLQARENKDILYSSLLPIAKTDLVKGRMIFVMLFELISILIAVPFAIINLKLFSVSNPAGIEPNPAYFGFVFIMFAIFNWVFITGFYKTAFKIGLPLVFAGASILVFYAAVEMLVWIPGEVSSFLDSRNPSTMLFQLPILLAGILIWIGAGYLTQRLAGKRFAKVDI